jgi:hypothetical protein
MVEFKTGSLGRLKFTLIYLITATVFFTLNFFIFLYDQRMEIYDFLMVFSVVILAILVGPPYFIMHKKIPHRVVFDEVDKKVYFQFGSKKVKAYKFEDIQYALYQQSLYTVIVFYVRHSVGSSGKIFYKEVIDLIGLPIRGFTWTREDLYEMEMELKRIGVPLSELKNEKVFFDRIM